MIENRLESTFESVEVVGRYLGDLFGPERITINWSRYNSTREIKAVEKLLDSREEVISFRWANSKNGLQLLIDAEGYSEVISPITSYQGQSECVPFHLFGPDDMEIIDKEGFDLDLLADVYAHLLVANKLNIDSYIYLDIWEGFDYWEACGQWGLSAVGIGIEEGFRNLMKGNLEFRGEYNSANGHRDEMLGIIEIMKNVGWEGQVTGRESAVRGTAPFLIAAFKAYGNCNCNVEKAKDLMKQRWSEPLWHELYPSWEAE
jgi:hypothetical protein